MKKTVGILLVLVTMSVILHGCGLKPEEETGNSNNSSATTDTSQTEADESADDSESEAEEIVEISFWNFPNYAVVDDVPGKYEEMLIEAFEAKNPNIKVNVEMIDFQSGPEKINTSIAAGTSPDVLYDAPGRIISWGKDGILAPLNDMITDEVKANVSGSILDASSYEGNVYMYPTHHAPFMMAFNRDMLEELGLMDMINLEGDRSWTVDEFEALLRALKDNGQRGPMVFASSQGGDQGTRAFIANLYDSPITNDALTEYTINSENGVKSLEWVINAIDEGLLENGSAYDANAAIDEFVGGRLAGTLLWSPGLEKIKIDTLNFETVFLPFPNSEKPKLEFLVGGLCIIDNHDEKKIEAAKKFIDFIANDPEWAPKNIESTGSFPVDQRITVNYGTEAMDYNASMSEYYGTYYNTIPGFVEMRTFWFPMLQATINHAETAEDALNDFVEKSNATIK